MSVHHRGDKIRGTRQEINRYLTKQGYIHDDMIGSGNKGKKKIETKSYLSEFEDARGMEKRQIHLEKRNIRIIMSINIKNLLLVCVNSYFAKV